MISLTLLAIYNYYRVSYALLYLSLHVLYRFLHLFEFLVPMHPLQAVSLVLDGLVNGLCQLLLITNHDRGEHHRDVISSLLGFLSRATWEQLAMGCFLMI